MPRLENWRTMDCANGTYYLNGDVYDDDRFPDGMTINTSMVQWLDMGTRQAQTRNTLYSLGAKFDPANRPPLPTKGEMRHG